MDDSEIAQNIYSGQRIGSNAAENNALKDVVIRAALTAPAAAIVGKGDVKEGYRKIGEDLNTIKNYAGEEMQEATNNLYDEYPETLSVIGSGLEIADKYFATPAQKILNYPVIKTIEGVNYLADSISGEANYLANHGYDSNFWAGLGITTGVAVGAGTSVNRTAYNYYSNRVSPLDVSTPPNSAVFYSGRGNRELAENFAITNNKQTLEMTNGGSWLDQQNLYKPYTSLVSKSQANQIWDSLSQRYAQEASGSVVGFVDGARSNSTFNRIEYPTLINNKNITNVITGGK